MLARYTLLSSCVCPSVRPSVTHPYCVKTARRRITQNEDVGVSGESVSVSWNAAGVKTRRQSVGDTSSPESGVVGGGDGTRVDGRVVVERAVLVAEILPLERRHVVGVTLHDVHQSVADARHRLVGRRLLAVVAHQRVIRLYTRYARATSGRLKFHAPVGGVKAASHDTDTPTSSRGSSRR